MRPYRRLYLLLLLVAFLGSFFEFSLGAASAEGMKEDQSAGLRALKTLCANFERASLPDEKLKYALQLWFLDNHLRPVDGSEEYEYSDEVKPLAPVLKSARELFRAILKEAGEFEASLTPAEINEITNGRPDVLATQKVFTGSLDLASFSSSNCKVSRDLARKVQLEFNEKFGGFIMDVTLLNYERHFLALGQESEGILRVLRHRENKPAQFKILESLYSELSDIYVHGDEFGVIATHITNAKQVLSKTETELHRFLPAELNFEQFVNRFNSMIPECVSTNTKAFFEILEQLRYLISQDKAQALAKLIKSVSQKIGHPIFTIKELEYSGQHFDHDATRDSWGNQFILKRNGQEVSVTFLDKDGVEWNDSEREGIIDYSEITFDSAAHEGKASSREVIIADSHKSR